MTIEISDVTNSGGTGSFDVLMDAVNTNLTSQFDLNRITGSDYATVYLGAIQVAMQQAIHFSLTSAQTDEQIALIEQQELTETQNTLLAEQRVLTEYAQTGMSSDSDPINGLMGSQINKLDAELDSINKEDLIKQSQSTQDLALKQSQQDLIDQQALVEQENIGLISAKTTTEGSNNTTVTAQGNKANAETSLLDQKKITEYAQTDLAAVGTAAATSVLGKQKALYEQQTIGFKRKAATDALRINADMWITAQTQTESVVPGSTATLLSEKGLYNMLKEVYDNSEVAEPTYDYSEVISTTPDP